MQVYKETSLQGYKSTRIQVYKDAGLKNGGLRIWCAILKVYS